jgi:hypothetical protein
LHRFELFVQILVHLLNDPKLAVGSEHRAFDEHSPLLNLHVRIPKRTARFNQSVAMTCVIW